MHMNSYSHQYKMKFNIRHSPLVVELEGWTPCPNVLQIWTHVGRGEKTCEGKHDVNNNNFNVNKSWWVKIHNWLLQKRDVRSNVVDK